MHTPVLLKEVLELLKPKKDMKILDATFGRGGHSRAFLERGASVVAMDCDPSAIAVASELEKEYGNFRIEKSNFSNLSKIAEVHGQMDAVLFDLGVSSPQLETPGRGFSFRYEGPLDMRMDPEGSLTAEQIVNEWPEHELVRIFKEYGEEKQARRLARAIVAERRKNPFKTTSQLADFIVSLVGMRGKIHPATRIFQALRIAVNDELGSLRTALGSLRGVLKEGGRFAAISFHSLEDRIVKQFIHHSSQQELTAAGFPFGKKNPDYFLKKVGRYMPSDEEVQHNPRARSARLRVAERIFNDEP